MQNGGPILKCHVQDVWQASVLKIENTLHVSIKTLLAFYSNSRQTTKEHWLDSLQQECQIKFHKNAIKKCFNKGNENEWIIQIIYE